MTRLDEIKKQEANRRHLEDYPYLSDDCNQCWLISRVEKLEAALKEIYSFKDSTLLAECCPTDSCLRSNGECCNAQISAHNAFVQSAEKARAALSDSDEEMK